DYVTADEEPIQEISYSEEIYDIINSVQKMMAQLARSKNLRYKLRRYTNLGPVNDVKTRWNSMYSMLERTIDLLTLLKQEALICPKMELIKKFVTN
ncbi:MAG: hypothetical protein MHPSP_004827, partial [Paramarteilia canceri]